METAIQPCNMDIFGIACFKLKEFPSYLEPPYDVLGLIVAFWRELIVDVEQYTKETIGLK